MILHLITDDKFADYVIEHFSKPECHSHIVIVAYQELQHIKELRGAEVIRLDYQQIDDVLGTIKNYSAIVLHGLFYPWCQTIIDKTPKDVKIAWMFWGGEIYGRNDVSNKFLGPITKGIVFLRNFTKKKETHWQIPYDYLSRINYCLTDLIEEYDYAHNYIGNNLKYCWYNYYSIEDTVGKDLLNKRCTGNGIWIGNSSTVECNYFETFIKIKRLWGKNDRDIIVPLSYGSIWLKNLIIKLGRILFGTSFIPLTDFLYLPEYNAKMLSCATMIQGHYRPQAQGNIITGLWLGMRVFLSEKSMTYSYFKRIGIHIFSIEKDLRKFQKKGFPPLERPLVEDNRQTLSKHYSKEHIIQASQHISNLFI